MRILWSACDSILGIGEILDVEKLKEKDRRRSDKQWSKVERRRIVS